jgi:tight adherence protein C
MSSIDMPTELLIAISTVFVAVALVAALTTAWWLDRGTVGQKRLRRFSQSTSVAVESQRMTELPDPILARLSKMVPKSPKDMSRLQRRMTLAGYPQFKSTIYFAFAQLLLPIVFAGAILLVAGLSDGLPFALLAAPLGYVLPGFYIGRKTKLRQKAIQNGLPDALDLLTLCVEAGGGLDQSIVKTSEELKLAHPILAEELCYVTTEMRAGKPRMEAFRNLAQRTGVDDLRTLVTMLTQTDRFGTSIGQALRTHAETARTKRRQRAEERAGKVGVKLVFPLALCLFPALYVVCFGPVMVRIYRTFFESGM